MQTDRHGLDAWTAHLGAVELPVLRQTLREVANLGQDANRLNAHNVGPIIGRDPMMTVRLLRQFEGRRGRHMHQDVCKIEQMLVMLGVEAFLSKVPRPPIVQDVLRANPEAQVCMLRAVLRAQRAAHYAADWAARLHDLHFDEIRIAAILHDLAEVLMWCFAPDQMLAIRHAQQRDRTLRSRDAQMAAFGFSLLELQLALARQWELPALLLELMDDSSSANPRVRNVALAISLARHSANGWDDAALPDDYRDIGGLLRISPEQVMLMVGALEPAADDALPAPAATGEPDAA